MLVLSFLTTSSAIPRNPQIRSRNFEWKKKNVFTAFRPTWTISQTVFWCWELFSIRLGTSSPQVQQIRMKEIKTGKSGFWKEADRKDTKSFVFFIENNRAWLSTFIPNMLRLFLFERMIDWNRTERHRRTSCPWHDWFRPALAFVSCYYQPERIFHH